MNSKMSEEVAREIKFSEIKFDDRWYMIPNVIGQIYAHFFSVSHKVVRPFEIDRLCHFMIRYEMSSGLDSYERVVYGSLDLLGDIGGLLEAITIIAGLLLSFIQFEPLNSMLISKLYSYVDPAMKKKMLA